MRDRPTIYGKSETWLLMEDRRKWKKNKTLNRGLRE